MQDRQNGRDRPTQLGSGGSLALLIALVGGRVEAHRGDITVCNEGPGWRFTVRLPLAQAG